MKRKSLLVTLLLLLLIALVACGGEADEAPVEVEEQPAEIEEEPAVVITVPADATLPPPVVEEEAEAPDDAVQPEVVEEEVVVEPEEPAGPLFPWPEDRFGYGIQVHGNATVGDASETMNAVANQLGMDWIKMQIKWPTVYPDPEAEQWFFYDSVVDEAYRKGLNVMASVVGGPKWTRAAGGENGPPDDYTLYYDFLDEMLTRYEGKIQAVEVWNEQNLDREWTTPEGLSPAAYVQFLSGANERIKAINPNIIVISGALSPTGIHDGVTSYDDFIYMDEMLAAGLVDHADCVGAHHNGYNIPPDVPYDEAGSTDEAVSASFRGPFDNPHHSWSFRTTLDSYAEKVRAADPDMQLCVTEFGWPSSEGHGVTPQGFDFAADNTLDEQATYVVQAFRQMHDSGDVWLAYLFNFDFGNKGGDPATDDNVHYSIVDGQGAPRPAYGALAGMEKTP